MRKLAILENLIRVHRYSGNVLVKEESVSDHICCMNALALEYIPIINRKYNLDIDIKEVIYAIAVHDLDEALYTDIPRPFKHRNERILTAINDTVDEIFKETLGDELLQDIKDTTNMSTLTGFLVKIFDLAQAGYKMISEIKLGNEYFESQIINVTDTLNGLYEIALNRAAGVTKDKNYLGCMYLINEFLLEFKPFSK